MDGPTIGTARRWSLLAIAVGATLCVNVFINAAALLIPTLHTERGLDLAEAGLVSAMPTIGMLLTLIAWGAVVDRVGERLVLAGGSALVAVCAGAAAAVESLPAMSAWLVAGGMAAASSNAASGRLVVGWFPAHRRGLAMGVRQTAVPLGMGVGALIVPRVAQSAGVSTALLVPAALCAAAALVCAVGVLDPPRPARADAPAVALANPYRGSSLLARIHAVSVLLSVPQAVVWTFGLTWLMVGRSWDAAAAGALIMAAQAAGAAGRIAAGVWSDRLGDRLRPVRAIAVAAVVTMACWAFAEAVGSPLAVALFVVASVVTVSDNGLAFTAVAETAGPFWSGRALGAQNTGQFLASAATAPLLGGLIGVSGYAAAFGVVALAPAFAVPLVPVSSRRR